MSEIMQAILLGVVEGLTEFLPISSTGHLILTAELLQFKDTAKIFTVVIQFGAILAVVWNYRIDLWQRTSSFFRSEKNGRNFARNIIIATIPAGIFGLLLADTIEAKAGSVVVASSMIIGGIVLLFVDRKPVSPKPQQLKLDNITPKQALLVGLAQTIALIPGVSRSGASIVGGLSVGLNRVTATALSFYLGIPVIGLASGYKLANDFDKVPSVTGGWTAVILGTVVSFLAALVAIRWLLRYISTHNFMLFAWYRIVLGFLVLLILEM